MAERKQEGAGPGGGEPGADRGGSPEPGPAARGMGRQRRYTPEEKRALLEARAKSTMAWRDFAATVGVPANTLMLWKRRYEEEGPRGLEPRQRGRRRGQGAGSRLPEPVQAAIQETKTRFPDFGFRKVRDYLGRFLHLKVSEGGVATVVKAMGVPPLPAPPKRRRRSEEPRRFERARPKELWQSDITSYLLGRHHRRVYLTVFLDDHSRYVVSWNLQLHQRQELVTDCLQTGIERFGKPREVLTDQGRQYFAWRGKSDFQKLLAKEGIQHVVARTHHPQTVGKCERLWKTVAEELIDRAHPEDLEETRERLQHYFQHYNHFRPHQGLDGMTPADRFFGVEEQVRREVEGAQAKNALLLALGEKPRVRNFVVGIFDGHPVAGHGGKDGLIFTRVGEAIPATTGGKGEDHDDDRAEADAEVQEADALRGAAAAGGGGAGAVGAGAGGGAEAGARDGGGDAALLAGEDDEGRGDRGAEGDGAAPVATQPDGGVGDGGGAPEAAPVPEGAPSLGGDEPPQAGPATGEGARGDAGAGEDPQPDAGSSVGAGPCEAGCATREGAGTRSGSGCGSTTARSGEAEGLSPGATA